MPASPYATRVCKHFKGGEIWGVFVSVSALLSVNFRAASALGGRGGLLSQILC